MLAHSRRRDQDQLGSQPPGRAHRRPPQRAESPRGTARRSIRARSGGYRSSNDLPGEAPTCQRTQRVAHPDHNGPLVGRIGAASARNATDRAMAGHGFRWRACPLLVALVSCGGKVALQEVAATLGSTGAVGNPAPNGSAAEAGSVAPEAAAAADDGSTATSEGGAVAVADTCPSTCTGGCDGGTCAVACGQPCPFPPLLNGPLQCRPPGLGGPPAACQTPTVCPPGRPCQISCAGLSACQGPSSIACPNDAPCRVLCTGTSTCEGEMIVCPSDAPCEIICNGVSACQGATIQCPTSAPCTVQCNGPSACSTGTMTCGKGPCTATCAGNGSSLSVVGCKDSSSCHNGC
jgi:hypothetical protein